MEADTERAVVEAKMFDLDVDHRLHAVRAWWQRLGGTRW
jgi:hypothetical protein